MDGVEKWQIGVFTSIDAGLGVDLDVANELEIPTIQIHAPQQGNRNQATADTILKRLAKYDISVTAVFGGFEGESYADIPTVENSVGLVPAGNQGLPVIGNEGNLGFRQHAGLQRDCFASWLCAP